MLRKPPEQRLQVLRSALTKEPQQRVELAIRQGRCVGEAWIIAILAGEECKRDGAFARKRREPFDPVAPPTQPPQRASPPALGVLPPALEQKIARERMP